MTTQVAIKEIENLTAKLFLSQQDRQKKDQQTQEQIAEIIFSKFSQLKGTGLKLLQALALDEDLLPKPYIQKFEAAYGKVTPLTRPVVKKVIKSELGDTPERVFKRFDYNPIAAASLGQVHEALLESGASVVVKVQYPNVAQNMQTDMNFVKAIASAIGNPLIKSSLQELSESLIAETDYTLEAKNLQHFAKIPTFENLTIPRVIDSHCSKKVLTMSRIAGKPLNCDLKPSEINQLLQSAFEFFFHTLNQGACIHADPHPGNFLFSSEGCGVVDFGSVKKNISASVVELFMQLLNTGANESRIVDLYEALGATIKPSQPEFYNEHVKAYHQLGSELLKDSNIDFSSLRPVVSQMRKTLLLNSRVPCLQGLSSEFTLLHKAFQSLMFLLCKYKATLSTECLNQFRESHQSN
jgi:predicted unusual protein kinase regulating ubiquinone biosynthesis (AarF/ABC1/UbiB family)